MAVHRHLLNIQGYPHANIAHSVSYFLIYTAWKDAPLGVAVAKGWETILFLMYMVALKRACWLVRWRRDLGLLLGLLGEEDGLDVGQDTSLGDGDTREQLVQLLVVPDGELEVTGDDPGLLVVTGGVAGQLEDLSGEVLHDGGHVDGGAGSDTLGIVTLPQQTVDTSDGELKTGPAGPGLCLSLNLASLSASRHVVG